MNLNVKNEKKVGWRGTEEKLDLNPTLRLKDPAR